MNTKTLSIIVLSGLIMVSFVIVAACSPIAGVPVALAQPDTVETARIEEDIFPRWEIDVNDIAAARRAAHYLSATQQISNEISAIDISAVREATHYLEAAQRVSHEISIADISAAYQAAHYLSVAILVSGELDVDDILAARQAAQTLNKMLVAGRVDLKNLAQRMPAD